MTISLCMIVRDEAALLPRFLEAARGAFDEFCAVDTGSRDTTVALVQAAGGRVLTRAWDDDFAAARNASLAMATGEFVLILDPDELPGADFARALRAAVADATQGAWTLTLRNLFEGGHHRDATLLRVFVRDPAIRFVHRMHEDAGASVHAALERRGLGVGHVAPVVEHLGYLRGRAQDRAKEARDRRLLQRALADDPRDLYSHFKLLEQGRFWQDGEALAHDAAAAWELLGSDASSRAELRGATFGGELLTLLASGLHPTSPRQRLDFLNLHGELAAPSPALLLARGELREAVGAWSAAREDFEACLTLRDATGQRTGCRPLLGLARLALLRGAEDEALGWVDRALDASPRDPEALLCALALGQTDPARVERFVERHAREHGPSMELARALLSVGALDAVEEVLRLLLPHEPAAALGIVVVRLLQGEDSDVEIDLTQEQADAALRRWIQTLRAAVAPDLWPRWQQRAAALSATFPWVRDASG